MNIPYGSTILAFQVAGSATPGPVHAAPEPDRGGPDCPLPEREWGLSAGQVVAVVVAIIAACQVFGLVF